MLPIERKVSYPNGKRGHWTNTKQPSGLDATATDAEPAISAFMISQSSTTSYLILDHRSMSSLGYSYRVFRVRGLLSV